MGIKKNPREWDIEIEGEKLRWNSVSGDWVNSPNAVNEVGCIHTVQGYDLNYVGVIIGPELSYDPKREKIIFHREFYKDRNGHAGVTSDDEVKSYILNIYKTLLTRGVRGVYVYAVDANLRRHFMRVMNQDVKEEVNPETWANKVIDTSLKFLEHIRVPLVGSAPCGSPLLSEENTEKYINVDGSKIRSGVEYFIVRASGDSMDEVGIRDNDLVLCRYAEKGETGDRVVALLDGENVTIKYYDKRDGRRVLLPKSSNPIHQPIIPTEGDEVQGVVQEVLKSRAG